MTRNAKVVIALVLAGVAVLAVATLLSGRGSEPAAQATTTTSAAGGDSTVAADDERLVRPGSSQRLSEGPDAVFVEFLDFACEACGAVFPTIEQLRAEYGDRVTFVVRYLPLHASSTEAARAAEAAAGQGRFEDMYRMLFETQSEWGESQESERTRFFSYAEQLGLDMAAFERAFDDPATAATIEQGRSDAESLGLTGTPSFFIDGKPLKPQSVEGLVSALDAAIAN